MKKIITVGIAIVFVLVVGGIGLHFYQQLTASDLNINERIIAKSIDESGKPKEIAGKVSDVKIDREWGQAYFSIPVNVKRQDAYRMELIYDNQIIDEGMLSVSEAGYLNYEFSNLSKMKPGNYFIFLYNEKDELIVYASCDVK